MQTERPFLPENRNEFIAGRRRDFGEMLLVRAVAGQNWLQAHKNADNVRVARLVKASVPALTTDADALTDFRSAQAAWLESLRANSVFDAALPSMRRVPMLTRGIVVTQALVGGVVAEGGPKPVGSFAVDSSEALQPRKAVGLAVASQELLRQPGARELLDGELRRAVGFATDQAFLAELIAATTPIASVDPATDLAALLAAVDYGATARLFFVVSAEFAAVIVTQGAQVWPGMTYAGGTMGGVQVAVSDALPPGTAVMFDASQIVANPGEVTLDASSQTAIQQFDPPTIDSTTPTPAQLVSMFHTNSTALKLERTFAFNLARTSAVASLSGVATPGP